MSFLNQWTPEKLVRVATYVSVCVATVLIGVKFFAWIATGALSLQATLVDSLLDAVASVINLVAVAHAQRPADGDHRFGHGKIEAIAALGQSLFIGGSAVFLLTQAADRFLNPAPIRETGIGLGVMVFSILITSVLVWFQKKIVVRTGSAAIAADSIHYQSDILINGSVFIVLAVQPFWPNPLLDPLFGGAIAVYILWTAWTIAREAFHILIDRECTADERAQIIDLICSHPDTRGFHDLRTRSAGLTRFIQFHLELDGNLLLKEAHRIALEVAQSIRQFFPGAEVIIHEDPQDDDVF